MPVTARRDERISTATVDAVACAASQALCSSNASVNALSCRAHGTQATTTP
jgi:hypothetical protein